MKLLLLCKKQIVFNLTEDLVLINSFLQKQKKQNSLAILKKNMVNFCKLDKSIDFKVSMSFNNTLHKIFLCLIILCLASFSANASEPIQSAQCNVFTFDSSSSYDPDNKAISVFWDFGDGESSTESVTEHTYSTSGIYQVTLSISDNTNMNCSTAQSTQHVKAVIPPTISWKEIPQKICVEEEILMDASASTSTDKKPLLYQWNFGDNTPVATTPRVQKKFVRGGNFTVELNVTDQSQTTCGGRTEKRNIFVNEPPLAEAGEEELLICINDNDDQTLHFDASQSTDANQDQLTYIWDFGDGKKGQGVKTSHRYRKLGNYDVKLIVQDNSKLSCDTSVDFIRVKLNKAPKAEAGPDILACSGESVVFDGSESYSQVKGTLVGKWDFGDGSSAQGITTNHIYEKFGKYQARLTVENKLNAMCPASYDTRMVTINARPTVSIKSPSTTCLGTAVNFDASNGNDADGDTLEYYWSFGDGTILRSGSKVSHEYKTGGSYRVSVIVDDGRGTACSTATAHAQIRVNTPPVADAGLNLTCCVNQATTFDATGSRDLDGDRLSYTWDFGDGTVSEGAIVTHAYSKSGTHNVTLTVDDNSGSSCSTSKSSFVATSNSTPVPIIKIR